MAYKIQYGPKSNTPNRVNGLYRWIIGVLILASVCTWINRRYPDQLQQFRYQLLPWTQPGVADAVNVFAEQVSEGVPVADAVDAFCWGIIEDAGLSS